MPGGQIAARHGTQVGPLAGEEPDLADELRRAVGRDDRLARLAVALEDPDLAGQHHDQVVGVVAVGEQHISGGYVLFTAVPAQHLKLGCGQVTPLAGPSVLLAGFLLACRGRPRGALCLTSDRGGGQRHDLRIPECASGVDVAGPRSATALMLVSSRRPFTPSSLP